MKIKAFTMIEVMMALVVVSIMLAVLAPVIITPPGNKSPEVQVMDTTPVGVIVAWWGTNYPNGWLPLNGQPVTGPEYEALRAAIGGLDTLPDLNRGGSENSTNWIIKAVKK